MSADAMEDFAFSTQSAGPAGNQSEPAFNRSLLLHLSHQMALQILPALVYLGVLMVVGTVGNGLVVYIFAWRMKFTTQSYLFVWLAVFDLMSCTVGIPSEMADISLYYAYNSAVACKVMRFLLTLPPVASVTVLLVIAVDRYRRVCKPLHVQMHLLHAKVGVGVAVLVAVGFAVPALSIYGRRTISTKVANVSGFDCSVQDKYQGRLYPLLYEMIFGVAFLAYAAALVTMYVHIWCETRRHRRYLARHSFSALPLASLGTMSERESDNDNEGVAAARRKAAGRRGGDGEEGVADAALPLEGAAGNGRSRRSSQAEVYTKIRKSLKAQKLTVIAVVVTGVFVLSYLPHLTLIIIRTQVKDFDHDLSPAALTAYNIFLRSYFVNSVTNVFVYGFMNNDFQRQCRAVLGRLFSCCSPTRRQRRDLPAS